MNMLPNQRILETTSPSLPCWLGSALLLLLMSLKEGNVLLLFACVRSNLPSLPLLSPLVFLRGTVNSWIQENLSDKKYHSEGMLTLEIFWLIEIGSALAGRKRDE